MTIWSSAVTPNDSSISRPRSRPIVTDLIAILSFWSTVATRMPFLSRISALAGTFSGAFSRARVGFTLAYAPA